MLIKHVKQNNYSQSQKDGEHELSVLNTDDSISINYAHLPKRQHLQYVLLVLLTREQGEDHRNGRAKTNNRQDVIYILAVTELFNAP